MDRTIPHLYQSFQVLEHADDDGIGEGVWGLYEEIEAVMEDEAETSSIHFVEPGEQLWNWTSMPLLIPRTSWNKGHIFMLVCKIGGSLKEA